MQRILDETEGIMIELLNSPWAPLAAVLLLLGTIRVDKVLLALLAWAQWLDERKHQK